MKKNLIIFAALASLMLTSCKKDNWLEWKVMNEQWLADNTGRTYVINDSAYTVRVSSTGLQYIIVSDPNPTEAHPGASSTVVVDYRLNLIHQITFGHDALGRDTLGYAGTSIDSGKWTQLSMSSIIDGFREGLEKIHTHGDIVLFVPYALGYGPNGDSNGSGTEGGSGFIPPYSTLIFTIHLCDTE